jgi:hypothetical protein
MATMRANIGHRSTTAMDWAPQSVNVATIEEPTNSSGKPMIAEKVLPVAKYT